MIGAVDLQPAREKLAADGVSVRLRVRHVAVPAGSDWTHDHVTARVRHTDRTTPDTWCTVFKALHPLCSAVTIVNPR